MHKIILYFYLLIICVSGFCNPLGVDVFTDRKPLSLEESAILKPFFQVLVEESQAGYVFFGQKPVCIQGFFNKDPFLVNTDVHKQSIALREGARIWDEFNKKNSNLIIHTSKKEDIHLPGYTHVLVINQSLFLKIVEENIALFQFVLGPFTTPQSLLNALNSNNQTYYSLLKQDKVLIGNILGFGMRNSLYVSRIENIQEAAEQDIPPFKNTILIAREFSEEFLPFQPSFSFQSGLEELKALEEKITISSSKLLQNNPCFVFGCLNDADESDKSISDLENTQVKIQDFLNSSDFLEKTLEFVTGNQYQIPSRQGFRFRFDGDKIDAIVARGIWEAIQDYDREFIGHFINGMKNLSSSFEETLPRRAYFSDYRREIIEARKNLKDSDDLFQSFENSDEMNCIIPHKLYYKILDNTCSTVECKTPLVSLDFSILSFAGHCINYQSNQFVNLKNTISGFMHGVRGMKIGETREIFIHPSLAYGIETSLDKCIPLRAVVTLRKIHESHDSIPPAETIDLSFLLDEKILLDRTNHYKKMLSQKGRAIGNHLKKSSCLNLDSICDYLLKLKDHPEDFLPTTDREQALINKIHWNIYFGIPKSENPK